MDYWFYYVQSSDLKLMRRKVLHIITSLTEGGHKNINRCCRFSENDTGIEYTKDGRYSEILKIMALFYIS